MNKKIPLDEQCTEYSTPRQLAEKMIALRWCKTFGENIINQGWASERQCEAMCKIINSHRKDASPVYNVRKRRKFHEFDTFGDIADIHEGGYGDYGVS